MRPWSLARAAALVAALAACKQAAPGAPGPSAGSAAGSAGSAGSAVPAAAAVALFVDDQPVAQVAVADLARWPRLDALLPVAARKLGMWQTVYLRGAGKPSELSRPSQTYPEMVPVLFPGEHGAAFGMFDPVELARHGQPALRQDGVTELRIKLDVDGGRGEHERGDGVAADPTKLTLTFKTPRGERALTGAELLELPREPAPGANPDAKGWLLTTLLRKAGIERYERLLLSDASGLNLTLDKADLDPAVAVPFVKLNKQGALRFRIFRKKGEGWETSGDLRGLVSVEVTRE